MINVLYTLIIYPIVEIIELVFVFSQKVFKSPGISVLAIGAAISILTLPLYAVAEKWQQLERDTQKRLAPDIAKIKAVFKGDEQYMILSTYYRQNHYHPIFTLRSAFGLLIQIPFFIAAFSYLSHLEALQGASFLFIKDLGVPDALITGGGGGVNVLPIAMTLINIIAGAIYTRGFPLKDKIQLYGMALIFLVLLYNSPAGLVVYWTLNNVFSLVKNIYYKFDFKGKNTLAALCISAICVFLSFYMIKIYKGDMKLRILFCWLFLMAGAVPWLLPLGKRAFRKISAPAYTGNKTFLLFIVSFAAFWIIIGIFLPSMLIASSPQEFSYIDSYTTPIFFILNTCLQAAGFFIFWPLCLYFLFPRKVKRAFSLLGLVILAAALCDVFFFPENYGIISVELVYNNDINPELTPILFNVFALAISAALILFLYFRGKYPVLAISAFLCLFSVFGFSFYNLFSIQSEFKKLQEFHSDSQNKLTTADPIFHLSKTGKNTVVIMLDRAQGAFFPYVLEESPELKDVYAGFVYYPNTVSFNGYTRMGAPPIFGGYEYTPLEFNKRDTIPAVTKHNEALLLMPRIFAEAGYEVTVTDPPYPNYSSKDDLRIYDEYPEIQALITDGVYTDLWIKEHAIPVPSTGQILKRNLFWYSIFKAAPIAFRKGIYLGGDWCAPGLLQRMTTMLNGYSVLDYLPKLTDFDSKKENTALIMVNNTTHENAFFQAPEYRPAISVTNYGTSPFKKEIAYHVNIAALKRLGDWFDLLKTEQVYDNTRIILVSDHGTQNNYVTEIGLPFAVDNFNPLLLVKDFNADGSLKTNDTFMSNADVPTLAFAGLIENPVNPFTGNPVNADMKKKPLYISITGSIHVSQGENNVLDVQGDYYVHDNIFDPANWSKAGK